MRQTQVIAAKCVKTESYFYFVKSHGKSHHKKLPKFMCLICERVSNLICFISEIILDDALKKMYQHLKFNSACFHNFLFPFPHTSNLTVVKNY